MKFISYDGLVLSKTFLSLRGVPTMRKAFVVTSLALVALWAFQATASAEMVLTTADGNGADSFVQFYSALSDRANYNMGARTSMETKNGVTGTSELYRKAYVRFDVSDVDLSELTDAAFEMSVAVVGSATQTFNLYGLNDGNAGENWIEGTNTSFALATGGSITWNNAPGNAAGNAVDPTSTVLLGNFTGGAIKSKVGISGDTLLDFLQSDSDGSVTFVITRDTQAGYADLAHCFYSKENLAGEGGVSDPIYAPTLRLETAVPEPSTVVLLLGMVAGLMLLHRK